ncbi:ATP-dependent helicase HrpB [Nitratireductor mangrovi]|uniref:ATP-dependent helicase HrpB n=1 Tax=Nitratireductor mangrovi TaxID=2599600 RepID=A0A5B8L2J9_9HYPH|nr:ATP-dependent helicase HrpB [Nitratireductor mangrovi]QDZ02206.1 ATP-dependent helicase HrpB [Nitratireductor mangrovi]
MRSVPALPDLPVVECLPALRAALAGDGAAVLVAPPGAGKTTLVPLALLGEAWLGDGIILLLEPRRLAARAAARRMAVLLGENTGETVGYVMRMDRKASAKTRVLVVTEGVLARMILDDPELKGVSAVIFDEFHERSLDGDFGLALALDVRNGLRTDLRLLVMSATLDGARVAKLLSNAPVIESAGRGFPVDIRYHERSANEALEEAMARQIRTVLASETGSVLAFLPGQREIERTAERLDGRVSADVEVMKLFGAMDGKAQDAAIRPAPAGRRKVVLATAIAETSITIDGVRVVIDCGYSRLPKFEPATGLTRLETVRVSRASADQRAGRAGRTEPGAAIRLWRAEQTASLPAFTPPEILEADLSGLMLDCAAFGVTNPARLAFLDPPPKAALETARALLLDLGAIDADARLTADGEAMRKLALPVRLAHMVAKASARGSAGRASELAVLLTERGLGGSDPDLDARLDRFRRDRGQRAESARILARRIAGSATEPRRAVADEPTSGLLLLEAWPDRVARARGERGRFVLANGRGAEIDASDRLAGEEFLVVADLQGKARNARIAAAARITEADIVDRLGERIGVRSETMFDTERKSVRTRETRRLGAITLGERLLPPPTGVEADQAILEAIRVHGLAILPWGKTSTALRHRLGWLHRGLGTPWPDVADNALLTRLEDWLAPFLPGSAAVVDISDRALADGLASLVPYELQNSIGRLAPTHYDAPSGSRVPIEYSGEEPVLAIRVQELFGLAEHPAIVEGRVPLTLELLSPANRPIQTTRDLPGFWRGSWRDVRSDMRGRYPKHYWPEDPRAAEATARAKPRR